MNLKTYRIVFLLITLGLSLVASFPLINSLFKLDSNQDYFSSIFILGPDHLTENSPINATANQSYSLFLDVENQMGTSESYMVRTKIRNLDQSVSELSNSQPSPLPSFYDFYLSISDQQIWERQLSVKFNEISFINGVAHVYSILFNDDVFPVDFSTTSYSEDNSFYLQLFCELWRYDQNSHDFIFTGQYVGIWFNLIPS